MYVLVFLIGATGGLLSGLLGIGGGIVLFPALLYLPPLFGFDALEVGDVTGLTMVQGFSASLAAWIFYRSRGLVLRQLVVWLGVPLALMSMLGALYSGRTDSTILLIIFGILALIAALMIFRPSEISDEEHQENHKPVINRALALATGAFLGFFLGMVGQGGAFIIIPVMLVVFKVPFRMAAGSMLAISLIATSAGFLGKAEAGLVPADLALALICGAVPFALAGGRLSTSLKTPVLRRILAVIILISTIRIGMDVYGSLF